MFSCLVLLIIGACVIYYVVLVYIHVIVVFMCVYLWLIVNPYIVISSSGFIILTFIS